MNIDRVCVECLQDMRTMACPEWADTVQRVAYRQRVRDVVERSFDQCAPVVVGRIADIYREMFGPLVDYSETNRRFNAMMLSLEDDLTADVNAAEDPLRRAVQYAIAGNVIDFAALKDVDEDQLRSLLDRAGKLDIHGGALEAFRSDLLSARRLALLTDNCGEIVADKVLLRTIRAMNAGVHISVLVRGEPIFNDVTLTDACQVRMTEVADRVLGNGSGLPGNVPGCISREAQAVMEGADVVISKGQANYEGLAGCGMNVYYIFMCKCRVFMERFGVPQFTGMLIRE